MSLTVILSKFFGSMSALVQDSLTAGGAEGQWPSAACTSAAREPGVVVWSGMARLSPLPETNWPFCLIAEDCLPMLLAFSFAFGTMV